MQKLDFFLDVHCGNAKPWALALPECFIRRRKRQMGEGSGTEGGWRADGLSCRNPSVLQVSFYQYSSGLVTTHAASCSPSFSPFFSFGADLITDVSSAPPTLLICTLPLGFIWVQCSGSPKQHCLPASMGLPPWPRPHEPLFPSSLTCLKRALSAWQLQEKKEKSNRMANLKSITGT